MKNVKNFFGIFAATVIIGLIFTACGGGVFGSGSGSFSFFSLTEGSVNRTSDTEATIGFTTGTDGTAYYLVKESGEAEPANTAVKAGTSLGFVSGTVTGKAVTLTAGTKDIYVVVEDTESNISAVLKINVAAYVAPDTTAPVLSAGNVNRTNDTEATIGFTTDEDGTAYYLVIENGEAAPANTAVKAGIRLGFVYVDYRWEWEVMLTAGAKDIYVVVEDAAGNISSVLKIEVTVYVCQHATTVWKVTSTIYPAQSIPICTYCGEITGTSQDTKIGDIGPAGGTIFYVRAGGFKVEGYAGTIGAFPEYTAFYMEAAPEYEGRKNWGSDTLIPDVTTIDHFTLSMNTTPQKSTDLKATLIGNGRKDTQIIVNYLATTSETGRAAQVCASKTVTVGETEFNDWFLPSLGELDVLYRNIGIALFYVGLWSSTQETRNRAWYISNNTNNGSHGVAGKQLDSTNQRDVRAIRAF